MAKAWIAGEGPRADAEVRLFCFAHAGGGAALFRRWDEHLAPSVDVCPVVLPGRESRLREAAYDSMDRLVGPLSDALRPYTDRPYALFGHSMGAAVAWEVARRLARDPAGVRLGGSAREPVVLFVSGRRAPHLPTSRRRFCDLSEDALLAELGKLNGTPAEVMDQRNLLDVFLPTLRADFTLNERYAPLPGPRLTCPVSALLGDADPEVDPDEIAAWRDATDGGFTQRVFAGDHFYLKGPRPEVLDALQEDLDRALLSPFVR
ncbi:thioesterase [Sphaerisporangium album]|uniref:Thioesterase n=1 Tax=Sphaerisporangium album TaxID=509200 RepID=A0A367FB27_9ACTN|nr:alpha/beta fold hydrolase [Sphaerisporangium album]RCG27072.1 thioesterase [Sphaerisporangium album]